MTKEDPLKNLKTFISELKGEWVSHGGMTGREIRDALGLKKLHPFNLRKIEDTFASSNWTR